MTSCCVRINLFSTEFRRCNLVLARWAIHSLRSRRYSRAQGEKLEIPPAQKLSILSSAHRAHGSAHTNVFALENQSERELLIMLLAGLQWHSTKHGLDWTGQLDWTIGLDSWTGQLDWTVGLDYWTGILFY